MAHSYDWNRTQAAFNPPQLQLEHEYAYQQQQRQTQAPDQVNYTYSRSDYSGGGYNAGYPQPPQPYPSTSRQQSSDSSLAPAMFGSSASNHSSPYTNDGYASSPTSIQGSSFNSTSPYQFQPNLPPLPSMPTSASTINNTTDSYGQYYDQISGSSEPNRSAKRARSDYDDFRDEEPEVDASAQQEQKDPKTKPGACARCKNLKVRCEFRSDTDPCKRCLNGGHECVIPGRKKRRTPPKREHLLNQIREQADQIQKLMAKLEEVSKQPAPLNTSTSDVFTSLSSPVLSPTTTQGPTFGDRLSEAPDGIAGGPGPETERAVEDWIAKAKGSLAEFGDFIGIAGSGVQKRHLVEQDPEDDPSSGDDEDDSAEATSSQNAEFEIAVETDDLGEEEERSNLARRSVRRSRTSTSSAGSAGTRIMKKDSGGEKLAILPSEAVPFGLMAELSLRRNRESSADPEEPEEESKSNVGIVRNDYFRSSPTPEIDPRRARIDIDLRTQAPHILTRGIITPQEAEELFKIYFDEMNLSCSIVDPVLYTPQKTFYRSPFLFTVICGIASRYYTKRPIWAQAMHYAQLAAGTALISGQKNVELVIGYILLSLYSVPTKRWEDMRGWMYLGLAIRIATELNLHLPNTAKPLNEHHAREQLNRTRVWLNCFNLDRSTGSQYGKGPIIPNSDYTANHSENWWRSSKYNLNNFDIQICCYNEDLRILGEFRSKIYSDPNHPTGLNKAIDFEALSSQTDEALQNAQNKWFKILDQTDMSDPQHCFRTGLLRLAYSYARLVVLSFGFQHAFGKGNTDENPFLNRCISAATDVCNVLLHDIGRPSQRHFLRHGVDAQSVFVTFAAAFLVKLLQPKFSSYLTPGKRAEIRELISDVIELLSSEEISIDDSHSPKLYALFLRGLLDSPLAAMSPKPMTRRSKSIGSQHSGSASNAPSPGSPQDHSGAIMDSPATSNFPLSPVSQPYQPYDQGYPIVGDASSQYMGQVNWPTPMDDKANLKLMNQGNALQIHTHANDSFFNPPLPFDDDIMQSMQHTLGNEWGGIALPGFSWMSNSQNPDVQMANAMSMYYPNNNAFVQVGH